MLIKPSTSLRNDYGKISMLARESQEPIYITKNGEGDGVFMSIEAFERREAMINMREKVMLAEQERISGAKTMSVAETREKLQERLNEI